MSEKVARMNFSVAFMNREYTQEREREMLPAQIAQEK
jgi:hypothetical protein